MNLFIWLIIVICASPFLIWLFFFVTNKLENGDLIFDNEDNIRYLEEIENQHKQKLYELRRDLKRRKERQAKY